jgi:hypothetical protein
MIDREREASDKQFSDESTVSAETQDCAKFFCNTLASLNKISEDYFAGLLKIIITAAEASRSLSNSNPGESSQTNGDELNALVSQLQSAANGLDQSNASQRIDAMAGTQNETAKPDNFCNQVESILILAMRNSVNAQQQAYVTGQAAITMAITKILNLPSTKE